MNTTDDPTGAHHEPTIVDRFRAWYFDGAGPRVRGAALRQRTARTIAFVGILVLVIVDVYVFGGPWLSDSAIQNTMTSFGASPYGSAVAILLFATGFMLQVIAPFLSIGLLVNVIGLAVVARRWRHWKQTR